jgi:outer membrane protein OmpA-like peptidoglycan-associated protein
MDTVKGMLTSEALDKAATQVGESPDGMRKAMNGTIPTVFAGLVQGVAAPGGAMRIFSMLTGTGATAQGLMSTVFGDRGGAVTAALGKSSGVKSGAASHALSLALPMIAGAVGKHVLGNRMTAGGLSQMLFSHKKAIVDDPSTPPGLAGALGLGSLSELGGAAADVGEPHVSSAQVAAAPRPERVPVVAASQPERVPVVAVPQRGFEAAPHQRSPWALLLPALLIGGLVVADVASLGRRAPHIGVTAPQPTAPAVRAPEAPELEAPKVGVPTEAAGRITLPGGKTLDVAPGGAAAQMAHALGDASTPLPHAFAFDNLTFDHGGATIGPNAAKGVDDLAAMLQAYPSAHVRVMGHADATGSDAANQALSESRAKAIKDALVAKGIAPDRIETAGEGARRSVPGADPESAVNRRAVVVLLNR